MEQGTNKRKLLTELKNIALIEKIEITKVLSPTKPALQIVTDGKLSEGTDVGSSDPWFSMF